MKIRVSKANNVFMSIEVSDRGTLMELRDYFSFQVPNAHFKRRHVSGNWEWDGSIKLFNTETRRLYIGLLPYLEEFSKLYGYSLEVHPNLKIKEVMSPKEVKTFIESLDIRKEGKPIKPRYYQAMALYYMINSKRATLVAPTAAGKSLIVYMFARWLETQGKRMILVVPTTNLVEQMGFDFEDYSQGEFTSYHKIYSGLPKNDDKKGVYITTWHSVYELPESYFDQFESVVVDEAHGAQAKSLKTLLEKSQAEYRTGLTGTMQDPEAHKWTIEGLLGKTIDLVSMQELMDRKWVSNLKINCIVMDHGPKTKKTAKSLEYHDEIKLILAHGNRTAKVFKAVSKVEENSFVLFDKVEYGERLFNIAKELFPERNVYLVYGATKVNDRETIRRALEDENGSIVIASYKVFSTGISINNLHHLFLAEPIGKSKFRIHQSIGRSLRLHRDKAYATLWDFIDKLTNSKTKLNHTMKHFVHHRIPRYNEYGYNYTMIKIKVEDDKP